jgi:CO/xanthine dehydrogenase Mo-binding subunit
MAVQLGFLQHLGKGIDMPVEDGILEIGRSVPRADARSKVSGEEKYAADYYGPNLVWAGVKRAGVAHGRLKSIDIEAAGELSGVLTVLTHKDISGSNRQGIVRKDQPVLVDTKIRHCGDAIALVLAEDKAVLNKALGLIGFDYEPLPEVFDAEKALQQGAPLVHEDNPNGNLMQQISVAVGDVEESFLECDVRVEALFEVPYQEHAYLETEAGWAYLSEDGEMVIVASTQAPFRDRFEIAPALGLDMKKIRVIAPYLGGAFGGKDGVTVQCLLGLAALHSGGRPVKMWWDREESFTAGVKRLPAKMHYRLGAKADGTLHALDCKLYFDTGPYGHLSAEVMALAMEHAGGPYRIPHTSINGWCIYTNNPPGGPFRGFGVPQVTAAMEQMIDMLAARLNKDPLEVRRKNVVRRGDRNSIGVTLLNSTGAFDCLETLASHSLWLERRRWKELAQPFKRRGVGLACLVHGSGYGPVVPDYANAKIELTEEGKIRVFSGVSDMGQGNASTCLQIVGAILGQNAGSMELVLPDTERSLPSGSASSSRCTYTYGNALIGASHELKKRLSERASVLLMAASSDGFALIQGRIRHLSSGKEIALSLLARSMVSSERTCTYYYRAPVAREKINLCGSSEVLGLPHILFSYAAHLADVEVDELTGEIEVKNYVAVSDCGRVINPQIYEQQIQGGIAQGLGYALSEDFIVENGKGITPDYSSYIIPTALDVPEMVSIPVEIDESTGPFGLKGVGEISISGPLPAVANALADACGVRVFRSPLTAEKVLKALEKKELESKT